MAGPWTQYQQPAAAPWLAYQAKPLTPEEIAAAKEARTKELVAASTNPLDGMGGGAKFAAGNTQSFRDLGLGLVQNLSEGGPMASGSNALFNALGLPRPNNPVKNWAEGKLAENADADAALLDDGYGLAGNIYGTVSSMFLPGGVSTAGAKVPQLSRFAPALKAAGRAFMPQTVKGGIAQGGLLGAVQPVKEGQTQAGNTGMGLLGGAVGGVLPRLLGGAARATGRTFSLFTDKGIENAAGRTLQRFTDGRQLNFMDDPILGRSPTIAEATMDPGVAQFQSATRNYPAVATAVTDSRQAANAARASALDPFAGTPAARKAAMDNITATEDAAYAAVRQVDGVNVRPVIDQIDAILMGPEGKRDVVRNALNKARKALFQNDNGDLPETSANQLLGARGVIKDLLDGSGDNGASKLAQKQLIAIRESLDAAIAKQTPDLEVALDARRLGMKPVNEMDAMQELIQKGTAPIPTADGQSMTRTLVPNAFIRAGDDLDAIARRGTGYRNADADNVFSPQAQDTIEGVRVGLARQQQSDKLGGANGSPTAKFLIGKDIINGITGEVGNSGSLLGRALNSLAPSMTGLTKVAGVPERFEEVLAKMVADPAKAQAILAALPAPDRVLLEQALGRVGSISGVGLSLGQE